MAYGAIALRPWPFGRPPWLGVTLMKCVIHWQESYPDNVGHWQCSVALAVPLTRASARLRKEPTNTFGKSVPHSRQYQSRPGIDSRDRECPKQSQVLSLGFATHGTCARSTGQPITSWCLGEQQTAVGYETESESKRMRSSANKGTREARLSMVVAQLSRSTDRLKHLPMRQPSGGAPVVV